jgi:hypothetical protein
MIIDIIIIATLLFISANLFIILGFLSLIYSLLKEELHQDTRIWRVYK